MYSVYILAHIESYMEIRNYESYSWTNQYGKLHRDHDHSSISFANSDRSWYNNGQLHRECDRQTRLLLEIDS
jgi:hypothetical protein